jgi:hypothetical protein
MMSFNSVMWSVPLEKKGVGWGEPALKMVPRVSLGYYIMIFFARLFTFLFSRFSVLIRAGGV